MRKLLALSAFALAVTTGAGVAQACRIPPPPLIPIQVSRTPYEAVALAEVVSHDERGANVRFTAVFDGQLDNLTGRLGLAPEPDAQGVVITNCGPPRPPAVTGDRLVVLLGRNGNGQYAIGWTTLEAAIRGDDFFQRFLAEQRPAERRLLQQRWHLVNLAAGPVPVGDPARWLAPDEGGLGWGSGRDDTVIARFDVDPHGNVVNCTAGRFGQKESPADPLCAQLRQQHFLPPIFTREQHGFYHVRWADGQAPEASRVP